MKHRGKIVEINKSVAVVNFCYSANVTWTILLLKYEWVWNFVEEKLLNAIGRE